MNTNRLSKDAKIYIAGHTGLVGSSLWRHMTDQGFTNLVGRTHQELELTDRRRVEDFFDAEKPEAVILAAAKTGGIHANNTYPAEFLFQNLAIQTNVIDAAYRHGVKKFVFLGASCMYPRAAGQPIAETALLSGELEPTNEAYAIAKISGVKMCEAYRKQHGYSAVTLVPTNVYGPGDNFDPDDSHVIAALMMRAHQAKQSNAPELTVWGTGTPLREFMYVDDLARAVLFCLENYDAPEPVNIGIGTETSIADLAAMICDVVGYHGTLEFDPSKPDGMPRKSLDTGRLHALGWRAETPLKEGLEKTYRWFRETTNG
jgi:GDP-L-fucose synthase